MTTDGPTSGGAGSGPLAAADEVSLDTPNCPLCLSRMEPDETEQGGLHWACPVCGHAAVA